MKTELTFKTLRIDFALDEEFTKFDRKETIQCKRQITILEEQIDNIPQHLRMLMLNSLFREHPWMR